MKNLLFPILACLLSIMAAAQPSDIDESGGDPVNDDPGGGVGGYQATMAGVNFTAFIDLSGNRESGFPTLTVENLETHDATVVLLGVDGNGTGRSWEIRLGHGEEGEISPDRIAGLREVSLVSLSPFRVTSDLALFEVAYFTHEPMVAGPRIHLPRHRVVMPDGSVRTVVVDSNGRAHFPVYGMVLGSFDNDSVRALNGAKIDILRQ